jgi:hypothetical protein
MGDSYLFERNIIEIAGLMLISFYVKGISFLFEDKQKFNTSPKNGSYP